MALSYTTVVCHVRLPDGTPANGGTVKATLVDRDSGTPVAAFETGGVEGLIGSATATLDGSGIGNLILSPTVPNSGTNYPVRQSVAYQITILHAAYQASSLCDIPEIPSTTLSAVWGYSAESRPEIPASGAGSATEFIQLTDTPASYRDANAGDVPAVRADKEGLEFISPTAATAGLNQLQVDARIQPWARDGNDDTVPDGKIASSITRDAELHRVATTGAYSDLSGRPTIPSATPTNRLLPAGGTVGQVLKKDSSVNYDASWQEDEAGTGGGGGTTDTTARTAAAQAQTTATRAETIANRAEGKADTNTSAIGDRLTEAEVDARAAARFTDTEKTKLARIATGAEVNVNADWNATSGDAQILNKPTIPSVQPGVQALTDGATINWNVDDGAIGTVTLAGNRTLAVPTGGYDGFVAMLRVTQDSTGSRTLTLQSRIGRGDADAPVLSTASGDVDLLFFIRAGAIWIYIGIAKGF